MSLRCAWLRCLWGLAAGLWSNVDSLLISAVTSSRDSNTTEQGFPVLSKQPSALRTPPLLRRTSYDRDAEVEQFSDGGFDDESTVDDNAGDVTPIALNFGQELRARRERQ